MHLTKILFCSFLLLSIWLQTQSALADEPVLLLLADYEWAHISIGDTPTESIRFDKIGVDLQLYFYSWNDSSTIYDQLVLYPNQTFTDPLRMFSLRWNGTFTTDNKLLLTVQSTSLEPLSVVLAKWESDRPLIGHPPMTYVKQIITLSAENQTRQLYDVLLDNEWLISFDWTWATIENQTLPQLRLYTTDGVIRDTRLITAEMKPLLDYGGVDGVGWILQTLTSQYAKWLLYSGHQITVRPNVGFNAGKPLPSFVIDPTTAKAEPGQVITIRFTLPQGVSNYTTNLEGYQKYLSDLPKTDYNLQTREYTLIFSFNGNAVGRYFTVSIQTMKHGIAYLSEIRLQIIAPAWQSLLWSIGAAVASLTVLSVLVFILIKTKRSKPTPTEGVLSPLLR